MDHGFDKENVYAVFEDRAGRIWFSTEWHGLCRLAAGRITCITNPFAADLARCLLQDREGRIWVGTSTSLVRIEGNDVYPVKTEDGRKIAITSLAEASSGALWVGTTSGLARFEDGMVKRVLVGEKPHGAYTNSLLLDADGTLWLGTTPAVSQWPLRLHNFQTGPAQRHGAIGAR